MELLDIRISSGLSCLEGGGGGGGGGGDKIVLHTPRQLLKLIIPPPPPPPIPRGLGATRAGWILQMDTVNGVPA